MNTKILYIAVLLSIVVYMGWMFLPKGSYYIGNAYFIFLLCTYIFFNKRNSFITFVLFGYSINNLIDETIFNDNKLHISEILVAFFIPILWLIRKHRKVIFGYIINNFKSNDR